MSIRPGTSVIRQETQGVGLVNSETFNPPSPVEYGKQVSGGVYANKCVLASADADGKLPYAT
jgi:hypothetical protein